MKAWWAAPLIVAAAGCGAARGTVPSTTKATAAPTTTASTTTSTSAPTADVATTSTTVAGPPGSEAVYVVVPNLTGLPYYQGYDLLHGEGLAVDMNTSMTAPACSDSGRIGYTYPKAATRVQAASTVTVYVYSAPASCA